MENQFDKIAQLLTSNETNAKVALHILKSQPELEKEVKAYFLPLLEMFGKKKLNQVYSIIKKIKEEKEPQKTFLPLLQHPIFSDLMRSRTNLIIKNHSNISTLFDLGEFSSTTQLLEIYNNKGLKRLPNHLGKFPKLESLRIHQNKLLEELPDSLTEFPELKNLMITNTQIEQIPDDFFNNFPNLIYLNIGYNSLRKLPSSLKKLKNLTHLYLTANELETLPNWIGELEKLEHLDLAKNKKLKELPPVLGELSQLKKLDLSATKKLDKNTLALIVSKMESLEELNLANNGLREIPQNLDCLTQLKQLILNRNKLSILPDSIQNLEGLKVLWLYNNLISEEEKQRIRKLLPTTHFNI
ncbi:MAG: leucine-rich repeat domain-containing protein [Saprospiraceae bacterium]|nr:leucine-rich repeat domain-containing protein [Saprospiraceae bacterium]